MCLNTLTILLKRDMDIKFILYLFNLFSTQEQNGWCFHLGQKKPEHE